LFLFYHKIDEKERQIIERAAEKLKNQFLLIYNIINNIVRSDVRNTLLSHLRIAEGSFLIASLISYLFNALFSEILFCLYFIQLQRKMNYKGKRRKGWKRSLFILFSF
jgi:hypothetical protein